MKNRSFLMLMLSLICFAFMPQMSAQVDREYKQEKYYYGQKGEGKIQVMDNKGRLVLKDVADVLPTGVVLVDSAEHGQVMQFDSVEGWRSASRHEILGYREYVAQMNQSGDTLVAPVATVLYNDLGGEVVWTYVQEGYYIGTLAGAFSDTGAGLYFVPLYTDLGGGDYIELSYNDANSIGISLYGDEGAKDGLQYYHLTVRVYD